MWASQGLQAQQLPDASSGQGGAAGAAWRRLPGRKLGPDEWHRRNQETFEH